MIGRLAAGTALTAWLVAACLGWGLWRAAATIEAQRAQIDALQAQIDARERISDAIEGIGHLGERELLDWLRGRAGQ